jgi:hypothetical protein
LNDRSDTDIDFYKVIIGDEMFNVWHNVSMRLSHYLKNLLFESFFASLKIASQPTYSSMSFEAIFKSAKKSFKNQIFQIVG